MEQKTSKIKKFWADNKDKILIGSTVTLAAVAAVQQLGIKQHNAFLKEHNLYEDYYALEED